MKNSTYIQEAQRFGQYIVGAIPSDDVLRRYEAIVRAPHIRPSKNDQATLAFVAKYPRMLGAIDAYSALFRPHSELRRRLYVMFAILEATPEYAEKFLPKNEGFWYFFVIAGVSLRAAWRVCIGAVVMPFIRDRS